MGNWGGAVVAWSGVDMLHYLTPAEYLRLSNINDVRDGIVAHGGLS
ncbi:phosphomethylpyrimidine synthase ThiC [Campylobacter sp. LR185c]|nr:phosphomethylpyrimidine synthase ThiC [Campylobacter sp. LR185c]